MEPRWLTRQIVDLIHHAQLQDHGGNVGVLQDGSVESAIARARNRYIYDAGSVFDCAAAYVFGLARNHGYADANKRTAYMAGITFLYLNGWHVRAPDNEKIALMLDVAEGVIGESEIASWLRRYAAQRLDSA